MVLSSLANGITTPNLGRLVCSVTLGVVSIFSFTGASTLGQTDGKQALADTHRQLAPGGSTCLTLFTPVIFYGP